MDDLKIKLYFKKVKTCAYRGTEQRTPLSEKLQSHLDKHRKLLFGLHFSEGRTPKGKLMTTPPVQQGFPFKKSADIATSYSKGLSDIKNMN